jgi:hypothetical protein
MRKSHLVAAREKEYAEPDMFGRSPAYAVASIRTRKPGTTTRVVMPPVRLDQVDKAID